METKADFKSIVIKNGLLLGGISVALSIIQYLTGIIYSTNTMLSILTVLVSIGLFIWFISTAIQQYKDANGGFLTVGEGVKIGAVVALIAGVIGGAYAVLLNTVIEPDFYQKVVALTVEKLETMGVMNEEQLEAFEAEMLRSKPSVVWTFLSPVMWSTIGGVIIGAIIGAVKKQNKDTTAF